MSRELQRMRRPPHFPDDGRVCSLLLGARSLGLPPFFPGIVCSPLIHCSTAIRSFVLLTKRTCSHSGKMRAFNMERRGLAVD
jgi:hypothetical protein